MKKIISLMLTALLAVNIFAVGMSAAEGGTVSADSDRHDYTVAEQRASVLKELGLFKGVSDTDFDLDRAPTRTEAVVMLIRLLGKESEAMSGKYSHPFGDVAEWADPYIGYAYEKKLTNGISATEFGASNSASAAMYLTFVLRALGYSDTNGEDFTWDAPFRLADEAGILNLDINRREFFRADVVNVSYYALTSCLKDSSYSLADKLIIEGVFTEKQFNDTYIQPTPVSASSYYDHLKDFTDFDLNAYFDENGYFRGIKASDYVKLCDYRGYENASVFLSITDDDVAAEIEYVLSDYISYEKITDRPVAKGDRVNVSANVKLKAYGMELANEDVGDVNIVMDAEDTKEMLTSEYMDDYGEMLDMIAVDIDTLMVKLTDFLDELVNGAIGAKIGDKASASISLPVDAGLGVPVNMELAITYTVNYICGDIIMPEFTEELAEALGFESFEELEAECRAYLYEYALYDLSYEILSDCVCLDVPDGLVEYLINMDIYYYEFYTDGALDTQMLEYFGYESVEQFIDDNYMYYLDLAQNMLMIQAIAEAEGITVTEAEVAESYFHSRAAELYGMNYAKSCVLEEKVHGYLGGLYS